MWWPPYRLDMAHPDPTTELLSEDDAVEAMPARRVKEAWVKMKLWEYFHEKYLEQKYGAESMANDEHEWLMDTLGMNASAIRPVLRQGSRYGVFEMSVANEILQAEDVVDATFDTITTDDVDEEKAVEIARRKVKTALHGCGMPRMKLARGVVQDYKAEVDAGPQEASA